jgi:hypothetical protein
MSATRHCHIRFPVTLSMAGLRVLVFGDRLGHQVAAVRERLLHGDRESGTAFDHGSS